jgi:ribosomal protein S18 acetylase RimI-like enzyme
VGSVRKAELADLNACLLIDPSFVTDHVWQMESRDSEGVVSVTFRTVRLPRPMKVSYPRDTDGLIDNWRRGECFLTAHEDAEVVGFLDMTIQPWNMTGWVNNLVVAKPHRRRGIGTVLLRSALRWGQEMHLLKVVTETQTKNYPAIKFYQKNAFSFCGYNDRYYVNQDIALFFVQPLR